GIQSPAGAGHADGGSDDGVPAGKDPAVRNGRWLESIAERVGVVIHLSTTSAFNLNLLILFPLPRWERGAQTAAAKLVGQGNVGDDHVRSAVPVRKGADAGGDV